MSNVSSWILAGFIGIVGAQALPAQSVPAAKETWGPWKTLDVGTSLGHFYYQTTSLPGVDGKPKLRFKYMNQNENEESVSFRVTLKTSKGTFYKSEYLKQARVPERRTVDASGKWEVASLVDNDPIIEFMLCEIAIVRLNFRSGSSVPFTSDRTAFSGSSAWVHLTEPVEAKTPAVVPGP
jgi:hypothetical protein